MRRALLGLLLAAGLQAPGQAVQRFTLPNGLRVYLLEDHGRPLLRAQLRVAWDSVEEPPSKSGLGTFLGALLDRSGVGLRSREAFDQETEGLGLRLDFRALPREFRWDLGCRSQDQEAAFGALALLIQRPALEGPLVEALRVRTWRGQESLGPQEVVRQRFMTALGAQELVDTGALSQISQEDLEGFYRRVVHPRRAVLGLVGDLDAAQARSLLLLHLGTWGPEAGRPAPLPAPAPVPRVFTSPEGPPEAWIGSRIRPATPRATAALELLSLILAPTGTPLHRGIHEEGYLLEGASGNAADLPRRVGEVAQRWGLLSRSLDAAGLERAREAWLRERSHLDLHPSKAMEEALAQSLGAPNEAEIRQVRLEDLQSLLKEALDPRGWSLLVIGVPSPTLARWRKEAPELGPWAPPPTTP